MMANTFNITNTFSIRAASFIPRDNSNAVKIITTAAMISMTPPLLPNGLDNDLGKEMPNGAIRPLAEKPEATKATAIKYSAKSAQPATHPNNPPKEH